MRIGILTQPLHNNYGGLLQNYALQQVLKRMGHEVDTIDHDQKPVSFIHKLLSVIKGNILHLFFPARFPKVKYTPSVKEMFVIRENTDYFINKYISRTKTLHSAKEFNNIAESKKYGAYVVGSDQCWRPRYNGIFLLEMFLRFAKEQKNVKRVSYAASFGTSEWEFSQELTYKCASLAKYFDLITVREANGVDLCLNHLGVDAKHVLDPTLLLDKDDYIKLVENEKESTSKGTLFYYILDPSKEKKDIINNIATKTTLKPFTVMPKFQAENRTKWDVKHRITDCIFPTVTSWLRGFMDAEMIICDSFHGCVFSIIFNKPFWVIENNHRGNVRFESLLKIFELEDRMISTPDNINLEATINWEKVNSIHSREKKKCLQLLNSVFK